MSPRVSRNVMPSTASLNLMAVATKPYAQTQKRPGPPDRMAMATPAMLPVPIEATSAVMNAWNGVRAPLPPLARRTSDTIVVEGHARANRAAADAGLIQLFGPPAQQMFKDSTARTVLTVTGSGRGGGGGDSFDVAEQRAVETAQRNVQARANLSARAGGVAVQSQMQISSGTAGIAPSSSSGTDGPPVRVGGNVRTPTVIQQTAATYPEKARTAGVRGTVILAVTIGADGAVSNARVLRSIPLLDEAAVDAVRQWR